MQFSISPCLPVCNNTKYIDFHKPVNAAYDGFAAASSALLPAIASLLTNSGIRYSGDWDAIFTEIALKKPWKRETDRVRSRPHEFYLLHE